MSKYKILPRDQNIAQYAHIFVQNEKRGDDDKEDVSCLFTKINYRKYTVSSAFVTNIYFKVQIGLTAQNRIVKRIRMM